MILCDEWTPAQVKAFRLMVNRSVTWADWDEELLALELQEIQEADFDLSRSPASIPARSMACWRSTTTRKPTPRRRCRKLRYPGPAISGCLGRPPGSLRRRHQRGSRRAAARRSQAAADGHRSAVRNRARFGMARSRRAERLRPGRAQLHEEAHRGPHRDHHLRRHARRLVRGVRAGAESRGRLCLARLEVHARSARWPAAHRLCAPPADHLGQGPNGAHPHALLVSARALLVCAEEERAVVRQSRRELHDLGFALTEVHHGRLGRREISIIRRRSQSS